MTCGNCGTELSAAIDQCPSCGTHTGTTTLPDTIPDVTGAPTLLGGGLSVTRADTISATEVMTRVGVSGGAGASTQGRPQPRLDVDGPRIGHSFGPRYHIIKLLGAGGMGAVYQAWDEELSVAVALKVIRTDRRHGGTATPEAERRFKNELLLARQVTHKNVVRIHDLGEIDGIKYITMPYIKGDDLATVLRRDGRMPIARALDVARQLAAGLEAAHEASVVHRDLKPPNIMISETAEGLHAQIMDFGISVSSSDAASGSIIGTLEYMAPEQAPAALSTRAPTSTRSVSSSTRC